MSNIVEQIFDKIESIGQTALGSDWHKMKRVFDPDNNDLRTSDKAFKCRHGSANSSIFESGVTKNYTMDHGFDVLLMRSTVQRNDDANVQETINELYDMADDLFKAYLNTKLELPTLVLNVNGPSIADPVILDNTSVLLILSFTVKYRQLLT